MNEMVSQQFKFLFARLLIFWMAVVSTQGAELEVVLDREQISLGETAMLQISVRDGEPQSNPSLTAVAGLNIQGAGTQNQVSIVNGKSTSQVLFNYSLTPAREGVFTIPPVQIRLDNKIVSSKPLTQRVSKDQNAAANANKTAYMRLALSKTNLVVGEVISAELQLFVIDGRNLQQPQLTGEGFVVQKFIPPTKTRTRIGNNIFNVLTYKIALSATKAGRLQLGPFSCTLEIPERRNAQRNSNDPFADFFGTSVQYREVALNTDPTIVNVVPVPNTEGLPNFTGGIGTFTMRMQVGPTNLTAGDPITLRIEWQGQGNLDAINLPALNLPGFKTYPPVATTKTQDPLGIEGSRYFEQVLIPESSDIKRIPALSLSYLDPNTRKFVVLSNAAVAIAVKGSTLTASTDPQIPSNVASAAVVPAKPIFAHILPDSGTLTKPSPVFYKTAWFWVANACPPLLCLGSLLVLGYRRRLAADPKRLAAQAARQQWHQKRAILAKSASSSDIPAFLHAALPVVEAILKEGDNLNATDRGTAEALRESAQAALYGSASLSRDLATDLAFLEKQVATHPNVIGSMAVKALAAIAFLAAVITTQAETTNSTGLFQQANRHYEVGQYQQAFSEYRQLMEQKGESFAVLFNAGNAAYQSGSNGWAMAFYTAAARYEPRNAALRANYEFLAKKLTAQPPPLPRWSFNEQAWLFALLNIACFACLFLRRASQRPQAILSWSSAGALAAMFYMAFVWFGQAQRVVVVGQDAAVRNGPLEESQTAFIAKDGTVLSALARRQGWIQVQDQGGVSGWLPENLTRNLP